MAGRHATQLGQLRVRGLPPGGRLGYPQLQVSISTPIAGSVGLP